LIAIEAKKEYDICDILNFEKWAGFALDRLNKLSPEKTKKIGLYLDECLILLQKTICREQRVLFNSYGQLPIRTALGNQSRRRFMFLKYWFETRQP